ncbi:metallophosphoesterase [Gorillibacterium massiliense]|uniref:metallophosphoesterase n=1 Tax=Gorillibacterium massiliense TaxID=1280390 RepID=UPI0004B78115|nr:metallophosphoesterase [Gorillibacterium massiliense]
MKLKPRFIAITAVVLLLYVGLNAYIGWHGAWLLDNAGWFHPGIGYWIVFAIIAVAYLLGRVKLIPGPLRRLLKVVGAVYFGLIEFALILLVIADLVVWIAKLAGYHGDSLLLSVGWTVFILLVLLMAWGSRNAWSPIVRTHEIKLDKWAGGRKELRVAVASDLHLGNLVGRRYLGRLVREMNAMEPDLILFAGDVIDDDIEPFVRNRMSEVLQGLQSPLGVYAVLGNHEYYGGSLEEYVEKMAEIGIPVLMDETVLVEDVFYVAGRKDKTAETADSTGRVSVEELLAGLDKRVPIILMDHQPYEFDKAAAAGADILLCGHTHRGQFAPNHWVTRRLFELDWGYLLKDKMHVIVSSGYGTWGPPIRLASRSEIIQLNIRFEG